MVHISTKYIGNLEDLCKEENEDSNKEDTSFTELGLKRKVIEHTKTSKKGKTFTVKEYEREVSLATQTIGIFERKITRHEKWIKMYENEFDDLLIRAETTKLSESEKERQSELINLIDDLKDEIKILERSIQTWKIPTTFTSLGLKRKDMDEEKLRVIIERLEKEMKEKNIIDSEEREAYYRTHLMSYFSTGFVKSNKKRKEDFIDDYTINDYAIRVDTKNAIGVYIGNLLSYDSGYDDYKAGKKGRWITIKGTHIFVVEGEKKQVILEKIKTLKKTPILKREEKKKEPTRRTLSPEEKQRRELEARAKKYKRPLELSKREKAIQKLIEETGYRRVKAEAIIEEKIGKEPPKKEKIQKKHKLSKKLELKEKQISTKLQKLQELNKKKYRSRIFKALLDMIGNYLTTGSKNTSQFANAILQVQKSKKIDKKQKEALLQDILSLRKEIGTLHEEKDFSEDLTHDFIDSNDLNDITHDFYEEKGDFTILHGPITRAGAFEYEKKGRSVIYYKDWDNIKEVVKKIDYIPLKASTERGSHHAKILGYATNFKPNDKTQQMFADVVIFNDINEVTNLLNPENGYAVSIGFRDRIENGIQWIEYIDHLALSLLNLDKDRCSTLGGKSCYAKQKEVNN